MGGSFVGQAGEVQQADDQVAHGGQGLGRRAGADATGVFAKRDVTHQVQTVLDTPMAADQLEQERGVGLRRRQAGDTTGTMPAKSFWRTTLRRVRRKISKVITAGYQLLTEERRKKAMRSVKI